MVNFYNQKINLFLLSYTILSCQCFSMYRWSITTHSHRGAARKVAFVMDSVKCLSSRMKLKLIYSKYCVILKDAILFTYCTGSQALTAPDGAD